MTDRNNSTTECLMVGEYTDDAACPAESAAKPGEVVRTQIVADFVDDWALTDGLRKFTVLLKDGRIVAVRGHGLKHEPHPVAGQDVFGIVVRTNSDDVLVALFKSAEVAGIFDGDLRSDRKIA